MTKVSFHATTEKEKHSLLPPKIISQIFVFLPNSLTFIHSSLNKKNFFKKLNWQNKPYFNH